MKSKLRELDAAAIERILKSVREYPKGLDRTEFRTELEWKSNFHLATIEHACPSVMRERAKRRDDFRKLMLKAMQLLRADIADDDQVLKFYPLTEPDPRAVFVRIAWAARRAGKPTQEPESFSIVAKKLVEALPARSRVDSLIGEVLGPFFKRYFPECHKEYTSRDGWTDGPIIRFVDAVLWELGITPPRGKRYTFSTIAAALTNAKKGRRRRQQTKRAPATDFVV